MNISCLTMTPFHTSSQHLTLVSHHLTPVSHRDTPVSHNLTLVLHHLTLVLHHLTPVSYHFTPVSPSYNMAHCQNGTLVSHHLMLISHTLVSHHLTYVLQHFTFVSHLHFSHIYICLTPAPQMSVDAGFKWPIWRDAIRWDETKRRKTQIQGMADLPYTSWIVWPADVCGLGAGHGQQKAEIQVHSVCDSGKSLQ